MGKYTAGQKKLEPNACTDREIREYSADILRQYPNSPASFVRDKVVEKYNVTFTLSRFVHLMMTSQGFLSEYDNKGRMRRRLYSTFIAKPDDHIVTVDFVITAQSREVAIKELGYKLLDFGYRYNVIPDPKKRRNDK